MTPEQKKKYWDEIKKGIKASSIGRMKELDFYSTQNTYDTDKCFLITTAERAGVEYTIKFDLIDYYLSIHRTRRGKEGIEILLNAVMRNEQHAIDNVALLIEVVI